MACYAIIDENVKEKKRSYDEPKTVMVNAFMQLIRQAFYTWLMYFRRIVTNRRWQYEPAKWAKYHGFGLFEMFRYSKQA